MMQKICGFSRIPGIIRLNLRLRKTFFLAVNMGSLRLVRNLGKHAYKNRKGQIFIPKGNGFYTFYPKELTVQTDFKIIITDLFINSTPVLPGKESPHSKTN